MRTLKFFAVALALMLNQAAQAQMAVPGFPAGPNPWLQYTPAAGTSGLNAILPGGLPTLGGPLYIPIFGMPVPFIGQPPAPTKPYTMRPAIPEQNKTQIMHMMMPIMTNIMRMSMPDAMNWFAYKIKAQPGVSFDDVIQSMNLRANMLNVKHVGENLMYKDFRAVLHDDTSPRIEVHSYCDIATARELLKIAPEFLVFLPCRIDVMEDSDKNIWIMMLDWNMNWVAGFNNELGITPELAKRATELNDKMIEIMKAGAEGAL
jgi:uncharacterized protein (DUF302 family)